MNSMNLLRLGRRLGCTAHIPARNNIGGPSKRAGGGHAMLVIPIASFCLGTWQVKRLSWKKGLIAQMELRTSEVPVPLPTDLTNGLTDMEYRRVEFLGRFDHSSEIYIGPRSRVDSDDKNGGGLMSSRPQSGYFVITPFILSSGGQRILVNRGWVPANKKQATSRMNGQVTGETQISGVVRKGELRPRFTHSHQLVENRTSHYCDVNAISNFLDTNAVLVDADSTTSVPDGPIGGQTRVQLRNEHLQYIITWYSLSAFTLYMYYKMKKKPVF